MKQITWQQNNKQTTVPLILSVRSLDQNQGKRRRTFDRLAAGLPDLQVGQGPQTGQALPRTTGHRLHPAGSLARECGECKGPQAGQALPRAQGHRLTILTIFLLTGLPCPQHSYKELLLLIFLIGVSGVIFASLAYFIEIEEVDIESLRANYI